VFQAPVDHEKDYIKRVIGLPGDSVMVEDGHVYINGTLLNESTYLSSDVVTNSGAFLHEGQSVTVPSEEYIVMGDNRPHSSDSREWGFVKKDELIGKSFFVYWPPQTMRIVKNPDK
jgi:signal peptidase I